jgi:hypothetical protein
MDCNLKLLLLLPLLLLVCQTRWLPLLLLLDLQSRWLSLLLLLLDLQSSWLSLLLLLLLVEGRRRCGSRCARCLSILLILLPVLRLAQPLRHDDAQLQVPRWRLLLLLLLLLLVVCWCRLRGGRLTCCVLRLLLFHCAALLLLLRARKPRIGRCRTLLFLLLAFWLRHGWRGGAPWLLLLLPLLGLLQLLRSCVGLLPLLLLLSIHNHVSWMQGLHITAVAIDQPAGLHASWPWQLLLLCAGRGLPSLWPQHQLLHDPLLLQLQGR